MNVSNSTRWVEKIRRKTLGKFLPEVNIRTVLSSEGPMNNSHAEARSMSPLINLAAFDQISDEPQVLRHIINIFQEFTPDTLEEINAGVAVRDCQQIALAAHSLKGSSAELGAEQLAELCHQLCMAARAGNRASAEQLATEVSRCYRETSTAMSALEFG